MVKLKRVVIFDNVQSNSLRGVTFIRQNDDVIQMSFELPQLVEQTLCLANEIA